MAFSSCPPDAPSAGGQATGKSVIGVYDLRPLAFSLCIFFDFTQNKTKL